MRSCETQDTGQIEERAPLNDFPAQPELGSIGAVPETVLDYCYANLFQQQLNGNASFGTSRHMHTTSRVMSKRHGAGKYATELLQLMSHNGEIGAPHPALRHEFHPSFIKECGYATLDLGELETAERCFSRLVGTEWEPSVRISAMLDKALVKSEIMELNTARELIEEATKLAKSEGIYTDQIQGRIRSRNAFLDFLDQNYDGALSKLNKLLADDISKADTEQLHLKIATLSTRKDNLQEPMSLCFAALFRETSAGHHHEALGFRIALARILREQGNIVPAEHIMETVQDDIFKYGCSERTYLSFLREGGRNLLDQGKAIRAYLAYLRPCLFRARDRKFGRFVETTSSLVQETMAGIKTARAKHSEEDWNSCIDQCVMDERKQQKNSRRKIQAIANLDPLFGYYSEDIEFEIESFRKEGAINAEIETISKLLIQ
jgi:hypothetical protein